MIKAKRFENAELSAAYVKFRPVYPVCVGDIITSYMRSNGCSGFECTVDAACGAGQSTFLLSDYFQHVVGVDISETQIQQAKLKLEEIENNNAKANVEFKVGDAHNLPIESSSVDLLTCAMAWHWLDADKFYAEARRVLKPRGCLAVYGHGGLVNDNERIKIAFDTFYDELLKFNCFAKENLHVRNNYEAVELPFSCAQRIEYDFQQKATMDQVLGMMSSMSMFRTFAAKYPENTLLQKIKENYEDNNSKSDVEEFTFPGFIIVGINDC